jgi:hypothetical protein
LVRPGVLNDIEKVLIREANEGGSEILIPVTIDDFLFVGWNPEKPDVATRVRARVAADFRGATAPGAKFEARFKRLLRALERSREWAIQDTDDLRAIIAHPSTGIW